MKYRWNYKDCIDLEYLIERDREIPDAALHKRDRDIFLELKDNLTNTQLKKAWLEKRRQLLNQDFLPGEIAGEACSLLWISTLGIALCSGFTGGFAYFQYSGKTPVNVFSFFTIFILLQLLLMIFSLTTQVIGRKAAPKKRSILLFFFSLLTMKMFNIGLKTAKSHLSAGQTATMQQLFARGKRYDALYRNLLFLSFFILLQAGGIFFNLGLLIALFTKVGISDIAFGWQSTLQFSTDSLYAIVKLIATPWSWLFGEGVGYPTLAEIEGSRIVLKEGIAHLATKHLISWWPFLLFAVGVYGLGIRLLLFLAGCYRLRRAEKNFSPKSAAAERILRRMQTPLVSSQTRDRDERKPTYEEKTDNKTSYRQDSLQTADILMPGDCSCCYSHEDLHTLVRHKGFTIQKVHEFQISHEEDLKILKTFEQNHSTIQSVILFAEAWMPPVMDTLSFIGKLREILAPEIPIIIWLIGKPEEKTIFTPVTDAAHIQAWTAKIEQLGDPYLDIIVQQAPS
ncbi:MAG: hypothetical protein CSA26_11050 [Desulfobacterales bacterium]|nr:MAG: hypothetical protein CSA26_11050 [Desulfobacterales bacterium]